MDTIIFLLIFAALLSMPSRRRWLVLGLFFLALIATVLLFSEHATCRLPLLF